MLKSPVQSFSTLKAELRDSSFAICRFPGEDTLRYAVGGVFDGRNLVFDGCNVTTWLGEKYDKMIVPHESTPRQSYEQAVDRVVESLRRRGGKTVVSRRICGQFCDFRPLEMAERYFSMFPDMFCFLFYHPNTGYWMGASPELLVAVEGNGRGHTRALAGTRRRSDGDIAWDTKNIEEHEMVVADICTRICRAGEKYKAIAAGTQTFAYGDIEHLCTPIDIYSPQGVDIDAVVSAIHPTAAVCGMPVGEAISEIAEAETVPRYFYGGTIVVPPLAYVVLRCVHFDADSWNVITGSGITARSVSSDEWAETEAKAKPLIDLLDNYSVAVR